MKRIFFYLTLGAVLVSAAESCHKAENAPDGKPDETVVPVEPVAGDEWSFTASLEEPVSKVSDMDENGAFAWEDKDEIKILWEGGNATATATVADGVATFTPEGMPEKGTAIWLVYPSDMEAALKDGSLVTGMPAVQKNKLSAYFVAKCEVGAETVALKHPVCYYKVVVDGDGADVTRMELASAADKTIGASSLSLDFDDNSAPVATPVGEAASVSVDFDGEGTYYFPVVPGVGFSADDLVFRFFRGEEGTEPAGGYMHADTTSNVRSTILNWGSLPAMATNRYVSTDANGTADGATPEAPWSIDQFKAFMEDGSGLMEAGTIALYDGITIHFKAGTYTPSAKIAPNINIRTNLVGEDPATTIFDGNGALLFDIWKQSGETVTFKNFTIQNARNTNDGGAVRIGNSDRVFNVLFENCVFTGNRTTASGKSGGVFCITGANASLSVKDCEFNQNVGYSCGGVLHAIGSSVVTFDNCTFTENSAVTGGVLDIQGTKGVTCNDCTFTANSATKYGGSGTHKDVGAGAIVLRTSGDAITLDSCTFDRNTVTGFGGAIASISTNTVIRLTECLFTGNNAGSGWGSCIHLSNYNGQRVYVDRCLFKENTTSSRGVIGISNSKSLVYMNDATFKDNTNANNNAWGVAVQASGSTVCMNNITTMGNHSTNASPGNTVVFNADSGWLITNSTIIDEPATALVRDNGTVKTTVCNSILINTTNANNVFVIGKGASYFDDCGHNVLSCDGTYNNAEPAASDKLSVTSLTGGAYSEAWNSTNKYGVYTWTNDLTGFTAATQAEVEAAIKSYDIDYSANISDVTHVGNDFWAWLESIGATGKDGRGEARTGTWWPGAYQTN